MRGTIQRCWNIRKILRNLCVRSDVTNRDVSGDYVIRYFTSNSRDKAEHLCEYWPVRESVCLFYTNRCQNITASTILLPNTTRISQHFHLGYSNVKSQGLQIDWIVFRDKIVTRSVGLTHCVYQGIRAYDVYQWKYLKPAAVRIFWQSKQWRHQNFFHFHFVISEMTRGHCLVWLTDWTNS